MSDTNHLAQRAMVLSAAKQVLKPDDSELFDAAFFTIGPSRKIRHNFVHHMWGYSTSLPDSLLLVDPKYFNRHSAEGKKALKEERTAPRLDLSQVFVWTKRDIDGEIENAERALYVVQTLQDISLWKYAGRRGKALRRRLMYEPMIQQRLQRR